MATMADVGFVEMHFGKVVGITTADGDPSCCVVPRAVSQDRPRPIWIGRTGASNLSASLTGVEFARPLTPRFAAGLLRALGARIRQVRIGRLVSAFGGETAYGSTVEVERRSGVGLVDARSRGALNLVAAARADLRRPGGAGGREGQSRRRFPRAILLLRALECEPMTVRQGPSRPAGSA